MSSFFGFDTRLPPPANGGAAPVSRTSSVNPGISLPCFTLFSFSQHFIYCYYLRSCFGVGYVNPDDANDQTFGSFPSKPRGNNINPNDRASAGNRSGKLRVPSKGASGDRYDVL
jgi:hypothetical protein